MLDEFLALQGDGFIDLAEQIVGGVLVVDGPGLFRRVLDVGDGGKESGLVLLEVLLLEPAGAGGLALDLLELGDAMAGVLGGFRRVVIGGVGVELAVGADSGGRSEGEERAGGKREGAGFEEGVRVAGF